VNSLRVTPDHLRLKFAGRDIPSSFQLSKEKKITILEKFLSLVLLEINN
jgi:hypothetical protein